MTEFIQFLKWLFELGTSGFWTFLGVLFIIGSLGAFIRSMFSFIPKRIHFGGQQTITQNYKNDKEVE